MTNKEENEIIRKAFEILKQRIDAANEYAKTIIDLDNPFEIENLNRLTKISIPRFGCFYITGACAARGPLANPSLGDDYDNSDIIYFRQLRFRPYKYFKSAKFRMTRSDHEMRTLARQNASDPENKII